ncbi:zinc finger protein 862-like isoform X3 [Gigantopelta aegis]|uniref:zinc finger protein 862-like isoform X3 n=1 Tax=Gigantopelta aegis TaxID=1735272 RepID=UPI001B889FF4|nr:zinc finger protein 862-like isoform X3 [Gigantopelta aegis]
MAAVAKKATVEKWASTHANCLEFECDAKGSVTIISCKICKLMKRRICGLRNYSAKYVDGTNNIKLDMVKKHGASDQHLLAVKLYTSSQVEAASSSSYNIKSAFKIQDKTNLDQVRKLLRTAFFIAKEELPFSLFPNILELQKIHGVQLGQGYSYDKACGDFVDCIEEVAMNDLNKCLASYLSVLIDGSTDSSTTERESVFILFMENGITKIKFLSLESAPSSDAAGVITALESALQRTGLTNWKSKCVGLGCDGASVNLGIRNGVIAKMREAGIPWLVGIHCYNHRLELALKDSLKDPGNSRFFV